MRSWCVLSLGCVSTSELLGASLLEPISWMKAICFVLAIGFPRGSPATLWLLSAPQIGVDLNEAAGVQRP